MSHKSNVPSKEDYAIVEPKAFVTYLNKGLIPDISFVQGVIILYDKSLLRFLKSQFNVRKILGFTSDCHLVNEKILICTGFGIGSPAATAAMEELITAGASTFISIGTAGAISIQRKLGDIVVCNKAWVDEGTSRHYIPDTIWSYPDEELTNKLYSWLATEFENLTSGSTWTTDAPFRETQQKLTQAQNHDIQTVEMEASALFTLGKFREVRVSTVFIIGDLLTEQGWVPGFRKKSIEKNCTKVVLNVVQNFGL